MQLEPHFESLAPELLYPILAQLTDLESLDNVLRASPAAFRVFNIYGGDIFESVLTRRSDANTAHKFISILIRIDALVRSSFLLREMNSLIALQNFVRHCIVTTRRSEHFHP